MKDTTFLRRPKRSGLALIRQQTMVMSQMGSTRDRRPAVGGNGTTCVGAGSEAIADGILNDQSAPYRYGGGANSTPCARMDLTATPP